MSPRFLISCECPHAEYEQYESERGLVVARMICHHPDREGCWCELDPATGGECSCELIEAQEGVPEKP